MKTCLYDEGKLNLQQLVRSGASDDEIKRHITIATNSRAKDGLEAEKKRSLSPVAESMATIGG
jgi:cyclic pyranopterin phosphate synthase